MDITHDFTVRETKKPKRKYLLPPEKQTILNSAELLRFEFEKEQYLNLKAMINAAVTAFR